MRFVLLSLIVLASAMPALAQSAPISLQGKLSGVPDGDREITVNIWEEQTGGTPLASLSQTATITGGVFTVIVDVPDGVFVGPNRWWSISLDGAGELGPRQIVASVPQSAFASSASEADLALGLQAETATISRIGRVPYLDLQNNADSVFRLSLRDVDAPYFDLRYNIIGEQTRGLTVQRNGWVGIAGIVRAQAPLHVNGGALVGSLTITGGSDLAEPFPAAPAAIEPKPGMVLSIDPETPGALRVSDEAYDTKVAGVYSGGNGLPTGMLMGKDGCELTTNGDDRLPLAMTGRVWVYADDSGGAIKPGDRLTTSGANAGYAARVADASRADGAVIGKAMTGIDEATGMVLVLVNLQ